MCENNCHLRKKCGIIYCYINLKGKFDMDVCRGDILFMKKPHPCGSNQMLVLRSGMDFKLKCIKCNREFMTPRTKVEKNIKSIVREKSEP